MAPISNLHGQQDEPNGDREPGSHAGLGRAHDPVCLAGWDRRQFLHATVAGVAASAMGAANLSQAQDANEATKGSAESIVRLLHESLTPGQREKICFDWAHMDPERGLLRTRVANNWQITEPIVNGDFYTKDQRQMIRDIFESIIHPDWLARMDKQMQDDAGGFGENQAIALFGKPGDAKYEFVLTGRHMTLRCDGNTAEHVAFGGPLFYGHDPSGTLNESPDHAGNVFWSQALEANKVYQMLDPAQRKFAEVPKTPEEQKVAFRGVNGGFLGIPVKELSADQKAGVQGVLKALVEPYRAVDREEVLQCLKAQGGLDACSLAFFTDHDIGQDRVWDNWRLEGPSFVWHFRGAPHVHVWVNVADRADVQLNA